MILLGIVKDTVNIRVFVKSRDRLKVRAAKERKTLMQVIEEVSQEKKCTHK